MKAVTLIPSYARLTKSCTGPDVSPFSIYFLPDLAAHGSLHSRKVWEFRKCGTVEKGCGGVVKWVCTLRILQ